jgi:DnaJ-class molecular chaperone
MTTLTCHNCDSPGDGSCPVCHGKGKIAGDEIFGGLGAEASCSMCGGSGECQTCDGTGEIEVGGEG